jgi:hypothetical protein
MLELRIRNMMVRMIIKYIKERRMMLHFSKEDSSADEPMG